MGAVMSHLGARIMVVLRAGRPYELRDVRVNLITKKGAMELIRSEHKVPEETRQARRQRKPNEGRLVGRRKREAAKLLSLDCSYFPRGQSTVLRTYNQWPTKGLTSIRKSDCWIL
jgi:hypothetical protein